MTGSTKGGDIDQIIIETTGVANPAPVVQTFYLDELMANFVKLDGVVAVVDSKHVERHLDAPNSEDVSIYPTSRLRKLWLTDLMC